MIGEQNANLMLNLWDTMGSDHLASMRKQDYEDCTVCVLTYDISQESTFFKMKEIKEAVEKENKAKPPIFFLIGNKVDLDVEL